MSKRAESLARALLGLSPESYEEGSVIRAVTQLRIDYAIELTDAELLKERERSAERACEALYPANGIYDCSISSAIARQETKDKLRAAIMSNEDDQA